MIERIKKACDILSHNQKLFIKIILLKAVSFLPDSIYIRIWYRIRLGRYPNLKNPKTFNEKLQWLKLNYRRPILTTLVDKYAVKEYVANLIGKEHIIPTIGIWDKFDDIDFEKLPDSFVLKCTHDSGGLVICKDKKIWINRRQKGRLRRALLEISIS